MEKRLLVIYDPDPEFVFRLMEFAKTRSVAAAGMEVRAVTTEENLRTLCERKPPELLLVSSSVMNEEIHGIGAEIVVLLLEDQTEDRENLPSVYKYQAPEELLRMTVECIGGKQEKQSVPAAKKGMEIIGVYSPVARTRKTSFALTLGQILARNRAVLYLNLETFAGFEQLFSEQYERTLSDLLYFGRQKETDLQNKISGIVRSIQNLDYVPPVICPEDLQSVQTEEWLDLFDQLQQQTCYEVLLLDLGEAVQGLTALLESCDRIYMPEKKDPMARAKLDQFFWVLEKLQGKEISKKIRRVAVPFCQNSKSGKEFFADLVWSELGDLVRKELSGEGVG